MKKRIISVMVTLAMLAAFMTPAFADDAKITARTQEDYRKVEESFENAEKQAGLAAAEAVDSAIIADETLAVLNEQIAEEAVKSAQITEAGQQSVLNGLADEADDHRILAEEAKDAAERDAEIAANSTQTARTAADTAKGTDSVSTAGQAADTAAAAANEAQGAAEDAMQKAILAKENAEKSESAYQEAVLAYEAVKEQTDSQLAAGLISAEEAVKLTEAAAKTAQEKQEAAAKARDEAVKAEEAQKTAAEEAKENLKQEAEKLEQVLAENAAEVAKDTAVAAATGLALEASKLASDLIDAIVNYDQEQYDALKEQVRDLEEIIDECDKAISDATAQAAAEALKLALRGKNVLTDYPNALDDLDAAQNALDEAKAIKDQAQKILDMESSADYKSDMNDLQKKVADGTETDEDLNALTEILFQHLPEYGFSKTTFSDIVPVEGESGIYSANIEIDGVKTPVFLKAVVSDGVVQYYRAELKDGKALKTSDALSDYTAGQSYSEDIEETTLVPSNNSYNIVAVKGGDGTYTLKLQSKSNPSKTYDISWNEAKGQFTSKPGFLSIYFDIIDPNQTDYAAADTSETNSNAISDLWAHAADPESYENEKAQDLETAKSEFESIWGTYHALQQTIKENTEKIDAIKNDNAELFEALEQLDKKLNGSLGDRVITSLINTCGAEILEMITSGNMDSAALLSLVTENWETIQESLEGESLQNILSGLGEGISASNSIANAIKGVSDGDITSDDVKAIAELLTGNVISEKMKQAIAHAVEDLAQAEFDKAKENLSAAIEKAEIEISEQTDAALKAGADYAKEELLLLDAGAKAERAELEELMAQKLAEEAEKAYNEAKDARDALEALKNSPVDDTGVKEAEEAYNEAKDAFDKARKAAEDAALMADQANLSAKEANEAYLALQENRSESESKNNAEKSSDPSPSAPLTGDSSLIVLWGVIAIVSLFLLLLLKKRKRA